MENEFSVHSDLSHFDYLVLQSRGVRLYLLHHHLNRSSLLLIRFGATLEASYTCLFLVAARFFERARVVAGGPSFFNASWKLQSYTVEHH